MLPIMSRLRRLYQWYDSVTRHPLFWMTHLASSIYVQRLNLQAEFQQLVQEHRERKQWMEPHVPDDEFLPDDNSAALPVELSMDGQQV